MTVLRRALLLSLVSLAAHADPLGPDDVDRLDASEATREPYGKDPLQFGELRLPRGKGPFPVAVVIHGGCWTKGYATTRSTAAIASALTARGIATWNIEYRQVGHDGGGWPGTFLDWAHATDHLRALAKRYPLDLRRVMSIGHSAGAHAALWLAARGRLPAQSELHVKDPLPLTLAVALDGPADLEPFVGLDARVCGQPVIVPLLGATPSEHPARYVEASPRRLLPLGVKQLLVSAALLKRRTGEQYVEAASSAGDQASLLRLEVGHFEVIAPGTPAWERIEERVLELLR